MKTPACNPRLFWGVALAFPVISAVAVPVLYGGSIGEGEWVLPAILSGVSVLLLPLGWWCSRHRQEPGLLPVPMLWRLLALALVYVALADGYIFSDPMRAGIPVFFALGGLCLLWFLLRAVSLLLWAVFLLLGILQSIGYHEYGVIINSLVLQETLEAKPEEVAAYLSAGNICLVVLSVAGVVGLCMVQKRIMRGLRGAGLFSTGCLFCLLAALQGLAVRGADSSYWPFAEGVRVCVAYHEALVSNVETVNYVKNLPPATVEPSSISTLSGGEGVVLVVHIGESLLADRMSLNGYARKTTPWLDSRQGKGLINFPDCTAAAYLTCQSQIVILTDARRDLYEKDPAMTAHVGSVLDLFDANGFQVFAFLGRRSSECLKHDRVLHMLTACARQRFNAPGSPWTGIEQIECVLRDHPKDNLVFLINNEGSHTPFKNYDTENPPFTPLDDTFLDPAHHAAEVNNAYDCTVHYTDEYVRRVVRALEGRPFVYLYVSDHGECLGQDDMWGRGGLCGDNMTYFHTTACHVGMFVLYSPEFAQLNPHFDAAIRRMAVNAGLSVAHEHIFHTLLGLFGISTKHYDPSLDLCSPEVQPYSGPKKGE